MASLVGVICRRATIFVAGGKVGAGGYEQIHQRVIAVPGGRHERRAPVGLLGARVCPGLEQPPDDGEPYRRARPGDGRMERLVVERVAGPRPDIGAILDQDADAISG